MVFTSKIITVSRFLAHSYHSLLWHGTRDKDWKFACFLQNVQGKKGSFFRRMKYQSIQALKYTKCISYY